jgi:putative two-component system hydrogenase maturation factor HypX/HoxX
MRQAQRQIDWLHDDTAAIVRKLHAADGSPGVADTLFGVGCHLYDAHAEPLAHRQLPGTPLAQRDGAVLCATRDGGVWIGHVRRSDRADSFKLPAMLAFADEAATLPQYVPAPGPNASRGWREVRYEAQGEVGYLHFDFYNGAMSTTQCERLREAVRDALAQPAPVLVLMGGSDFWCNGLHLNVIEAADSPADESWRNIQAMNDLTLELITASGRLVVAAMQGNAGAGGVFMALAADHVWARRSVVLNPHYKNMGNLYGSEYWSYLLPRKLKSGRADDVMQHRLPVSAAQAARAGLIDAAFGDDPAGFRAQVRERAQALAASPQLGAWLAAKQQRRRDDEARKPLAAYRAEELARMHRNFYGFDPSYHIARSNFVRRVQPSWTPRHLALHRTVASPPPTRG